VGFTKSGEYISRVCLDVMKEITEHAPGVSISGFIMESAAANRSAMCLLEGSEELSREGVALVNLQCLSHTLSLLLKDLDKRFDWVHSVYEDVLFISASISNTEAFRDIFAHEVAFKGGTSSSIVSHCETRFGSKYIVLRSVLDQEASLVSMCGSQRFLRLVKECKESAAKLHTLVLSKYGSPECLFERARTVKLLCEPVLTDMTAVEADKAHLSRILPLIKQLELHASSFSNANASLCQGSVKKKNASGSPQSVTIENTFNSRLREFCYKPSISAACLLDPVNFQMGQTVVYELAFDHLLHHEQDDAAADIERLGGMDALRELAGISLHGFAGLNLNNLDKMTMEECVGVRLSPSRAGEATGQNAAAVHQRRQLWLKVLSKKYPFLAKVAAQYLSMHGSSCASERNLSVFGRLYDKFRGRLQLSRAEKVVYLSVNDRISKGELVVSEEELLPFADIIETEHNAGDVAGASAEVAVLDLDDDGDMMRD
jgi:hypothetical protein